jgi:hypothetical protein
MSEYQTHVLSKRRITFTQWRGVVFLSIPLRKPGQDGQYTHNVTLRRVRATIVAVEKQWLLQNLSVCVFVDLVIQHAMRMRHNIFSLPNSTIFSTFSHKRYDFRKKILRNIKMCFVIFSTTYFWNISHSKKKWARYDKNVKLSSCKVPFIIVRFW